MAYQQPSLGFLDKSAPLLPLKLVHGNNAVSFYKRAVTQVGGSGGEEGVLLTNTVNCNTRRSRQKPSYMAKYDKKNSISVISCQETCTFRNESVRTLSSKLAQVFY